MENIQQRSSNVLLGISSPSDHFKIKYGILTFKLKIKPITCEQMIKISGEISCIKEINKDQEMFPAMIENISDMKHVSKAIAIATGTKFIKIVSRAVLKLPLKDVLILFNIVRKQSDPEVFFYIIAKTGKLNLLKKQPE
jgi:hypothetical protein